MAFTSKLGVADAGLGNVVLGAPTSDPLYQIVTDILSIVDGAATGTVTILDTLAITDAATAVTEFVRSASDSLTIVDASSGGASIERSVSDTITLTDDAVGDRDVHRSVSDTLSFTQSFESNIKNASASDTISLTQTVEDLGPKYSAVTHSLGLTQHAEGRLGVINLHIVDELFLTDKVGRSVEESVTDTLLLAEFVSFANPSDTLNLVQFVSAGKGNDILDELALTDAATYVAVLSRAITTSLNLQQSAQGFVDRPANETLYSPQFGGSTSNEYPQLPASIPCPLPDQAPFRLVYPATGIVTQSLILRAPNLGNKDRLGFSRINRETRGGTLIVFSDPIWPKTETLVLSFSALRTGEARALLNFIQEHLGLEIGVIDWEGRYWKGLITTPQDAVVQDGKNSFSASFEFEGEQAIWTEQALPDPDTCPPPVAHAKDRRPRIDTCCDVLETDIVPSSDFDEAETDDTVIVGSPLYMKSNGHVGLAQAVPGFAAIIGLSFADRTPGFSTTYIADGKIARNDWTSITGTALLAPGSLYFLSPTTAGRLTTTPPTTSGQYVAPVGRAKTTTTLDVEIGQTVRL